MELEMYKLLKFPILPVGKKLKIILNGHMPQTTTMRALEI